MDLQKEIDSLKVKSGYSGKPQQWQYGFDLACRELAKSKAIPDGFVLVLKEPNQEFKDRLRSYLDNLWMGEWGCDWDGFVSVNGIDPNEIWQFMIEAQEPTND